MTKEKENILFERYPKIFQDRGLSPKETLICFGLECDDGWFDLINNLCDAIQFHVDHNSKRNDIELFSQVVVVQIKEKFGGLRFYYYGGDKIIDGMVRFAEKMSYRICEVCGTNEKVGHTKGWIKTICKECYYESNDNRIWTNKTWVQLE